VFLVTSGLYFKIKMNVDLEPASHIVGRALSTSQDSTKQNAIPLRAGSDGAWLEKLSCPDRECTILLIEGCAPRFLFNGIVWRCKNSCPHRTALPRSPYSTSHSLKTQLQVVWRTGNRRHLYARCATDASASLSLSLSVTYLQTNIMHTPGSNTAADNSASCGSWSS